MVKNIPEKSTFSFHDGIKLFPQFRFKAQTMVTKFRRILILFLDARMLIFGTLKYNIQVVETGLHSY